MDVSGSRVKISRILFWQDVLASGLLAVATLYEVRPVFQSGGEANNVRHLRYVAGIATEV